MPRDYAHYTTDKKQPQKRKGKSKKQGFGKQIRWLLALFFIIVLVIMVIRLFHNNTTKSKKPVAQVKTQPVVVEKKDKQQGNTTASSEVQFDFYTTLPKAQVSVQSGTTGQSKFILQVAIVSSLNDAKHLESELSLLGLDVFAQPITIKGVNKYQVNIGPYISKDAALSDQKKLQANKIQTKLIEDK